MARGKREQWQAVVERWKASGLLTKEFCREAGVNYWTFSEWRRKLEPQRRRSGFVEVVGSEAMSRIGGGANIRLRLGGVTVEVESPVDEAGLVAVLRAVEHRGC